MATSFNLGGLLGVGDGLGDLLTPEQQRAVQQRGLLSAAAALLQAGGQSPTRIGLGQALGSALLAGQTGAEQAQQSALTQMLTRQKVEEARRGEQMRRLAPTLFREMDIPAQQTMYGAPAALVRDDEGNLLPGAQVTPASRQLAIDPARLRELAMMSPNPIETLSQVSKLVPDLRRAGLLGAGAEAQQNPFAIFAEDQSLPSNVRSIAQQYARSFASGQIDPEKVDERIRQLGEMTQRIQTQQQSQEQLAAFREQQTSLQRQAQESLQQQREAANELLRDRQITQQQHQEAMRRIAEQQLEIQRQAQAALEQQRETANQLLRDRQITQQQHQEAMRRIAEQSNQIRIDANTARREARQGQGFTQEKDLRSEFEKAAKPFTELAQAFQKIETAAKNPSGAGDISLVYGYMKVLDPGSVVREGEFATAANAGGVPDTVRGLYNRAIQGQRLSERVREDFLSQARNLIESQRVLSNDLVTRYQGLARQYDLNPDRVTADPFRRIKTPEEIMRESAERRGGQQQPGAQPGAQPAQATPPATAPAPSLAPSSSGGFIQRFNLIPR